MQEAKGPSLTRPSRTKPSTMVTATSKTSISRVEAIGFGGIAAPKVPCETWTSPEGDVSGFQPSSASLMTEGHTVGKADTKAICC